MSVFLCWIKTHNVRRVLKCSCNSFVIFLIVCCDFTLLVHIKLFSNLFLKAFQNFKVFFGISWHYYSREAFCIIFPENLFTIHFDLINIYWLHNTKNAIDLASVFVQPVNLWVENKPANKNLKPLFFYPFEWSNQFS